MGLYKEGKREIQLKREASVIIGLVEKVREEQPRLSVRKLKVVLQKDLDKSGIKIGRDGMFDLLREFDMLVKTKRFKHYTTNSNHSFRKYPNQIKDVKPTGPNRLWVSDITYIEGSKGFNYLSLITDAYSRKIVGHCFIGELFSKRNNRSVEESLERK